jgi:KaiC/GvpD/RAD55 family RecA-like ATPase
MQSHSEYSLGFSEFGEEFNTVPSGSNILIVGPPECGKDLILKRILLEGLLRGERAILVTSTISGISECEFYYEKKGIKSGCITFVDSISSMIHERMEEKEHIQIVPSPADITVLNIKIAQVMERYLKEGEKPRIRLGINSLSTFLMYNNPQVIYRFMHSLSGRVKTMKMLGVYVLEEDMHSKEIETMIKQLCNVLIEVKRGENSPLMRIVKYPFKASKWIELKSEE